MAYRPLGGTRRIWKSALHKCITRTRDFLVESPRHGRIQDFQRGGAKYRMHQRTSRAQSAKSLTAGVQSLSKHGKALESRGFQCSFVLSEPYFEVFWYKTGFHQNLRGRAPGCTPPPPPDPGSATARLYPLNRYRYLSLKTLCCPLKQPVILCFSGSLFRERTSYRLRPLPLPIPRWKEIIEYFCPWCVNMVELLQYSVIILTDWTEKKENQTSRFFLH